MQFTTTVRGVEVEVHAEHFTSDYSVGIGLGPEEVWATDMDGNDFPLTDEEVERLGITATEIRMEDDE